MSYYRDMFVVKTTEKAGRYLDLTENELESLRASADRFTKETLSYHCRILDDTYAPMKIQTGSAKRTMAEIALIKMCDSSLDNSTESLLSRISKLENIIASGVVRQAPIFTEKADDAKKADKKVTNTKKLDKPAETVSETLPKKESNPSPTTMKAIRGWNEIAERATASDASLKGFLKQARAYISEDGKVHVRFQNDFAKGWFDTPQMRDNVRAAINMITQKNVADADLMLSVVDGSEDASDLDGLEF